MNPYLNVTQSQFGSIREESIRMETTWDPTTMKHMLNLCLLDNGGTYRPWMADAKIPIELRVIDQS